jgi:hypothetical protein
VCVCGGGGVGVWGAPFPCLEEGSWGLRLPSHTARVASRCGARAVRPAFPRSVLRGNQAPIADCVKSCDCDCFLVERELAASAFLRMWVCSVHVWVTVVGGLIVGWVRLRCFVCLSAPPRRIPRARRAPQGPRRKGIKSRRPLSVCAIDVVMNACVKAFAAVALSFIAGEAECRKGLVPPPTPPPQPTPQTTATRLIATRPAQFARTRT